jgi:hypothetical protein
MITLKYAETVDDSVAREAEADLGKLGLQVQREQVHLAGTKYNAIEWIFPALVTIEITAAFAEGFIKKVGEGAGEIFNGLVSKAYKRLRGDKQRVHTRSDLHDIEQGSDPQTLGHALPRIRITIEVAGNETGRKMNLPFIFLPELTDADASTAAVTLASKLPALLEQQSVAIDKADTEPMPLAYVYKANRGWIADWQLVQEAIQRQLAAEKKTPHQSS